MDYKFQVHSTLCNNLSLGPVLDARCVVDVLHILNSEYFDESHLFMYLQIVEVE